MSRIRFALRYALRHLLISLTVAALSAAVVYGLLYPPPWNALLGIGHIFILVLAVDVACGPLLTLILASPRKSRRERWLDFSLIGAVQMIALAYGMHSVWLARPVVLAFERDRLVLVTANEVDTSALAKAPPSLTHLPWWGIHRVATRRPANNAEFFQSTQLGLAGISPAMRPDWWLPWESAREEMTAHARPLSDLIARRPQQAAILSRAAEATGKSVEDLRYLPLTTRTVKEWTVLLDTDLHLVGYAPVDAF